MSNFTISKVQVRTKAANLSVNSLVIKNKISMKKGMKNLVWIKLANSNFTITKVQVRPMAANLSVHALVTKNEMPMKKAIKNLV